MGHARRRVYTEPGGSEGSWHAAAGVAPRWRDAAREALSTAARAPRRRSSLWSSPSFAAAGLCFAGPAAAKSYVIDDVRIDAAVRPSGDLLVTEQRTFAFDGSYPLRLLGPRHHRAARASRCSGSTGPDGPLRQVDGGAESGATPSSPEGEVGEGEGALADVAPPTRSPCGTAPSARPSAIDGHGELYWQFVGDGWGAPTAQGGHPGHAAARREEGAGARLGPRPAERVGRGSERGRMRVYSVRDVPPETFVEGRILFPAAALSQGAGRPQGEASGGARRRRSTGPTRRMRCAAASSRSARRRRGARPSGAGSASPRRRSSCCCCSSSH